MCSQLVRASQAVKFLITEFPPCLKLHNVTVLSVRWRKPRWVPKSQSKLFYVREPTAILAEEYEMLKPKYDAYRTEMKALRYFFLQANKAERRQEIARTEGIDAKKDEVQHIKALEINRKWNEECARLREERLLKEREKKEEIEYHKQLKKQQEDQITKTETESFVAQSLESSEKFITMENLDEEIEKLLDSKTDYNIGFRSKSQKQ
ncbi:hypothetical protein SNE40_017737 [Patella caerulea]|uniref:Small ribosomal subunit protein mS26 n=1 Tax=Patella caerulea TaxID=87958 RepID=A0AAN8JAZ3_PATCE